MRTRVSIRLALVVVAVSVLFTGVACREKFTPLPDLQVDNGLDEPILVRYDILGNAITAEEGFPSIPSSSFSVWRFQALPSDRLSIDLPGVYVEGITIRIAVVTESDRLLMNESFSTEELDDRDWTFEFHKEP